MFDGKTIRIVGVILLCLPLLHVATKAFSLRQTLADPDPAVWEGELQELIARERQQSLPPAPIIVTGGLGVRLWKDLPEVLSERPTLLRPLGGASIEDLTFHYNRLLGYYRPSVLVVMPSYEELHFRNVKTPETLTAALRALLERNIAQSVTSRRYVVMPIKTLLNREDGPLIDAMSRRARLLERELQQTVVLDPNPFLAGANGAPNADYFSIDGVNLNEEGYALLSAMLRERLIEDQVIDGAG